jgi:hypothetical protein
MAPTTTRMMFAIANPVARSLLKRPLTKRAGGKTSKSRKTYSSMEWAAWAMIRNKNAKRVREDIPQVLVRLQRISVSLRLEQRETSCPWRIAKFTCVSGCRDLARIAACAIWSSFFCVCWRASPDSLDLAARIPVVAESVLIEHQSLILNRSRKRSLNLRFSDCLVAGLCALLMVTRKTICGVSICFDANRLSCAPTGCSS